MFHQHIYAERREKLARNIGSGIILLAGNRQSSINYRDNHYPFRQDSCFLYFFGIDISDLAAIIDIDNDRQVIYGDQPGVEDAVWTGHTHDLVEMADRVGVNFVKKQAELREDLQKAAREGRTIHYLPPYRADHELEWSVLLQKNREELHRGVSVPLIRAIVDLRSHKQDCEIGEITAAVNITAAMQLTAMRECVPGMKESELAGKLHGLAISRGVDLAFPTILTVHGEILHIHYGSGEVRQGNILLCDCGAESRLHYSGDLTRSFPVGRKWDARQEAVYDIVYSAQQAALHALAPGVMFRDIHLIACRKLTEGLKALGLMKGDVEEAVQAGAHALFFPCGTGHMLGLDTHDMENLGEEYVGYDDGVTKSTQFGLKSLRLARGLQPGFVVTVEPGLYFNPVLADDWQAKNHLAQFINYPALHSFRGFGGIRIEDVALITSTGYRTLGDALPTTAAEIGAMRSGAIVF